MQASGRCFYGFGAKEEDKMEELEEPRGATFLWLLPHRIDPESGNPGASLREPEPLSHPEIFGFQDVIKIKNKTTIFS